MKGIFQPAADLPGYERIRQCLTSRQAVLVSGLGEGIKDYAAAAFGADLQVPLAVVTANEVAARSALENLSFYYPGQAFMFPAKDTLFYNADVRGGAIEEERLKTLRAIREGRARAVVMAVDALYDRMVPHRIFDAFRIHKRVGEDFPPQQAAASLVNLGYVREDQIEHAGQFAMRGGIIDIFPVTGDPAFRVELWGDEIDSIRVMDTETQRSLHRLTEFTIDPAHEIIVDDATRAAGFDIIRRETEAQAARLLRQDKKEEAERIRQMTESCF